jgi:hypothetical protein
MIASAYVPIAFAGIIAAWPNGVTGATPPVWLPIVVGCVCIAIPHLVWLHDKRPEAQVSGVDTAIAWAFGTVLVIYGIHLWVRH